MELMDFIKLLTDEGARLAGWPIAALLYFRLMRLSDKVLLAFMSNTVAVSGLSDRINQALESRKR